MKKVLILLTFFLISLGVNAQTNENPFLSNDNKVEGKSSNNTEDNPFMTKENEAGTDEIGPGTPPENVELCKALEASQEEDWQTEAGKEAWEEAWEELGCKKLSLDISNYILLTGLLISLITVGVIKRRRNA